MAVAVFVLQAFAGQCRASRRTAQEEPLAAHVAGGPDEVADALETEHRVIDEERHHVDAVGGVRGSRRDERCHRPRLGDPFFEHLPVDRLLVIEERLLVDRFVELSDTRVDADLSKQRLHAEGARFVGNDRHHVLADLLVLEERREHLHERHGGGDFAVAAARVHVLEYRLRRRVERGCHVAARGNVPAQRLAARAQILRVFAVVGGFVERRLRDVFVGNGNPELVAERTQLVFVELLLLVRDVLALAALAQPVALDGPGQNHGRQSLVVDRGLVRRVHLLGVVATALQVAHLLVGQVLDHLQEARVGAEEVLANVVARFGHVLLELSVDDFAQALHQDAFGVGREQRIPVAARDQLDHVPARAAERGPELLDDLAVAAHRSVQALQVAIDHEDQVVESFARREGERPQRFGFVHLAVAQEGPHATRRGLQHAAVLEVAIEARLVDGEQRRQSHRYRRVFPEVRHQPRVRVRRDAAFVAQARGGNSRDVFRSGDLRGTRARRCRAPAWPW